MPIAAVSTLTPAILLRRSTRTAPTTVSSQTEFTPGKVSGRSPLWHTDAECRICATSCTFGEHRRATFPYLVDVLHRHSMPLHLIGRAIRLDWLLIDIVIVGTGKDLRCQSAESTKKGIKDDRHLTVLGYEMYMSRALVLKK
ncbi:hypothetical protein L596_013561 [Steinernema carpocapsae]|uniref:Uncharacterized protein n=1 Tax=Steinernema carpocapsae TaxID=34508 RepID=A0A4U5P0P2_STECR|nr:hypothetical protein L596_013561 [Steinernema carpocapsae]